MNKGIFGLQVFRRRKPACRAVAAVSAFSSLVTASLPVFAGTQVLAPGADGAGGAEYTAIKGATWSGNGLDYGKFTSTGKGGLIDWSKLNIGSGQTLEFDGARFYNVVNGGGASEIAGVLKANGALWIFNPAGVSFMNGAQVSVAGTLGVAAANLSEESRTAIENAIDTDGLMPTTLKTDALGGNVTVKGGTFKGAGVAFLGRKVAVDAGDFSAVGDLSLAAAGGKVTIDEVEGGKITVALDDFVDDVSGIGIDLGADDGSGEIKLGGGVLDEEGTLADGNLTATTEGGLHVNVDVKTEKGEIRLATVASDVPVAGGVVVGHKKMSVASGKLLQGKSVSATAAGRISADGSIAATDGDVTLAAAEGIDIANVTGQNIVLKGTADNATINVVNASGGNVTLASTAENVMATVKGMIVATDTVKVSDVEAVTDTEGASITAKNLELSGVGEVSLDNGTVSAEKMSGTVTGNANLKLGANLDVGDLTVGDTLTVTPSASEKVTATGEISAKAIVADLTQDSGKVTVSDTLTGNVVQNGGELSANTVAGDVTQNGADATMEAAKIDGTVEQSAGEIKTGEVTGTVDQSGGTLTAKDANLTIGGKLTQTKTKGDAEVSASRTDGTLTLNGGASVDGTLKANTITASDGTKIEVSENGKLDASAVNADTETSGTLMIDEYSGNLVQKKGTITTTKVTGSVTQSGGTLKSDSSLTIGADLKQTETDGQATVSAKDDLTIGGKAEIAGTVTAGGTIDVKGTDGLTQTAGEVTTTTIKATTVTQDAGTMTAETVKATDGVKQTTANAVMTADKVDGSLTQTAGTLTTKEVTDAAEVSGTVNGKGGLTFGSTLTQNGGTVTANGAMTVGGKLTQTVGTVDATGNTLTLKDGADVSGTVTAGTVDATGKTVKMSVGADVDVTGELKSSTLDVDGGSVDAKTVVAEVVQDEGTVTVAETVMGDVTQNGGELSANMVVGDVTQNGTDATMEATKVDGALAQTAGTLAVNEVTGAAEVSGTVNGKGGLTFGSTLTQNGGTVTANGAMTVEGKLTQDGGTINAVSLDLNAASGENTVAGTVDVAGAMTVKADLKQTDGTVEAGSLTAKADAETSGTVEVAGDVSVTGDLTQNKGQITAKNVTAANVTQKDGTMTVDATVEATGGDVVQEKGSMSAATVKASADVEQTGGEMTAKTVKATTVTQDGADAKILAKDGSLTVDGDLVQKNGTVATKADAVAVTGTLTQNGGTINADSLDLNAASGENTVAGTVDVAGAMAVKADLKQTGGTVTVGDTLKVDGALTQEKGKVDVDKALAVGGKLTQGADGTVEAGSLTAKADAETSGTVEVAGDVSVTGDLTQNKGQITAKNVTAANVTQKDGTMTVDATVEATGGDVVQEKGSMSAATVKVSANVKQSGGTMTATTVEAGADVEQTGGEMTAKTVKATIVTQDGADAKILAKDGSLTVDGDLVQKNGTVATKADAVAVTGTLTQNGGTLNGKTLDVTGALTQDGGAAKIDVAEKATVDGVLTQTQGAISAGALDLNAASGENTVAGTVDVAGAMAVKADLKQTDGTVTVGDTLKVDGALTQEKGKVDVDKALAVGGKLTQGADGTVEAGSLTAKADAETSGTVEVAGDVSVTGDLTQNKGQITAKNVTAANVTQKDGTMTVDATVEATGGDVVQEKGSMSAATVKASADVEQTGGEMTAKTVKATTVTQDGADAKILAKDGSLTVDGDLVQKNGTVATKADAVAVTGTLTQNGGTINAKSLDLDATTSGDAEHPTVNVVKGTVDVAGDVKAVADLEQDGADSKLTAKNVTASNVTQKDGTMTVAATVKASANVKQSGGTMTATTVESGANVEQTGGTMKATTVMATTVTQDGADAKMVAKAGSLTVKGNLVQKQGQIGAMDTFNDVTLDGTVTQNGGTISANTLTLKNGDVTQTTAGTIQANALVFGRDGDKSGKVELVAKANNKIENLSGGEVQSLVLKSSGDLKLTGKTTADNDVSIDIGGNLTQESGNKVTVDTKGYVVDEGAVNATIAASSVDLSAVNIGSGHEYVVVDGKVEAHAAGGNVSIAGEKDLTAGEIEGANVSLYTPGKLKVGGTIAADQSLTVTAKAYDYNGGKKGIGIKLGSKASLQVNNFRKNGMLIAAFKNNGGEKEPHFEHKPNNVLVFLDGRLIGGDINALNKLGALEAFPVQTPELKSKQGVFGDPYFLHDEINIANPLDINAIDYLLQDIPRLTLASDFPLNIEKQVAAVGLNPTTSYWFGQNDLAEEMKETDEAETSADED